MGSRRYTKDADGNRISLVQLAKKAAEKPKKKAKPKAKKKAKPKAEE
jgi:hypothetical protein